MERIDFGAIKKMPPERRVKALEELQEKLNELISERTKEISDSQEEIKEAQEFLKEAEEELAVLEEMEEQAPKMRKVDVQKLFGREETPQELPGQRLEAIASNAPRQFTEQQREEYVRQGARMPAGQIRERVYEIMDNVRQTGIITPYQQERLEQFREMLTEKRDAMEEGAYRPDKKSQLELTAAEQTIAYVTGKQHAKTFYHTRHEH
jgi:hypothetical protein